MVYWMGRGEKSRCQERNLKKNGQRADGEAGVLWKVREHGGGLPTASWAAERLGMSTGAPL